jgi:hypothetical protein
MRIFTETNPLPGGGIGRQDDAAAMFTAYPHAVIDTFVLEKNKSENIFMRCERGIKEPDQGSRTPTYQMWPLHSISDTGPYSERMTNVTFPEWSGNLRVAWRVAKKFGQQFANGAYLDEDVVRTSIRQFGGQGWRLVGYQETPGKIGDKDNVIVAQHTNQDCFLMFEGTNNLADALTMIVHYGGEFCGFYNCHTGVKNELWTLVHDDHYQNSIKPVLQQCSSVTCIGHSLGGALCELWTACANSGRQGDPTYELLAWTPNETPSNAPEVGVTDQTRRLHQVVADVVI